MLDVIASALSIAKDLWAGATRIVLRTRITPSLVGLGDQRLDELTILVRLAELWITEHSKGRVEYTFHMINRTRKEWTLDQVRIESLSVAQAPVTDISAFIPASGRVAPRSIGFGSVTIPIDAAGVKQILFNLKPQTNRRACPFVGAGGRAVLYFTSGKKETRVTVRLDVQHAYAIVSVDSEMAGE
jgi:hypothetical protein